MPEPKDPTKVRQGRLGKQVLVILVVSLTLAVVAGWILFGVFFNDKGTIGPEAYSVPVEVPALTEMAEQLLPSDTSGTAASN
ncbi:MAG: hypothetical protein Q8S27_03640 [Hoeflea sp.]|nr:hypothetical protein [Hoeflea sp.]MDZ7603129.1 hypothetical protein [Hoeflea sp.]